MSEGDIDLRTEWLALLDRAATAAGFDRPGSIPEDMSFISWCERLAANGLKVDGHPWSLADRPALRPLYEAIPTTIAEAHRRTLVLRKGSQLGATLWECLADLYMAMKFEPCVVGLYLPDQATAADKSQRRFLRIIRTIPEAWRRLTQHTQPDGSIVNVGPGNIMTRIFGESAFLFLWTSSASATESRPCDILSYDEVQNMSLSEIDRVNERMSASRVRFRLLLSTANVPGGDIDHWYKLGTMNAFHTECPYCRAETDLSARWPGICQYNTGQVRGAPLNEWTYVCPECNGAIMEPQRGRFIAASPGSRIESWHISQIQSPTIDAREMAETWQRAVTGDQKKQWYNRKLGLAFIDPEQLPVDMAACLACAEEGERLGLVWETSNSTGDVYLGCDQMAGWCAVIIKKRLPDGRQAVIHCEAVFAIDADPFVRVDELMRQYNVTIAVVEQLPNANDARRFCARWRGRAYMVAAYTGAGSDMITWGDAPGVRNDLKTAEEDRSRYSVGVQQYKMMQSALFRIKHRHCLFPSATLEQTVLDKGEWKTINLVRDWVFDHYCHTGLAVEQDEETRKPKPKVVKVGGVDGHFAFATMLCDVGWTRVHGGSMTILPESGAKGRPEEQNLPLAEKFARAMPGLPQPVLDMLDKGEREGTCGSCINFSAADNQCTLRFLQVSAAMTSCDLYDNKAHYQP